MEMHQIRYFLAVAETLNFTRAAADCHVAQPSLSRAIKLLEEELGGDLFRRERGRTHLTELGRVMQPCLRQAYESALSAKERAERYRRAEMLPLRLGISKTVALGVVAPMLVELARAFPGLELSVIRAAGGEILGALKAGDVEMALAAVEDDWDRLDRWPLFDEGFVALGTIKASPAGDVVIVRPYCEAASRTEELMAAGGVKKRGVCTVSGDDDALELAERGLGLAIVPASTGRFSPDAPRMAMPAEARRSVYAYAVAGRQRTAAVSGLLNLLRAADWAAA